MLRVESERMAGKTIQAAGGIVVHGGARPLVAVVQCSKDELWVLPRGKLKRNERPVIGARREAVEETGHRVRVHEFLGAISYRARRRSKVVQFWRMQAEVRPSRDLTKDIVAVEWLTLAAAVRRLSSPLEKLFLRNVGRHALKRRKHPARRKTRAHVAKVKSLRRASGKPHAGKYSSRGSKARSHVRKSRTAVHKTAARAGHPTMLQRVLGRLAR
jgi:8-oxo-dGTP diphosphatase